MIRKATSSDFKSIYDIINNAAQAYKGKIPEDCWHEPYMPEEELMEQINDGVVFYCYCQNREIIGVMGIQDKSEVDLIRHAYVRTDQRSKGIGGRLLRHLITHSKKPVLIGTWKAAVWAIGFYEKHGFRLVTPEDKDLLLRKYWKISDRQIETSVVLADKKFLLNYTCYPLSRQSGGLLKTKA